MTTNTAFFLFLLLGKMTIYQNDYIIVDVDKTTYGPLMGEDSFRELIFDFTIQCNGKIRRHRFTVSLEKQPDGIGGSEYINGWCISNMQLIYNPFRMLKDLGYDVPDGTDLHPLVANAFELF